MKNTKNNFIDSIGNTPLIKLKAASKITGCNIYGKAEYLNPGGSVKDRAALALIKDAQEKQLISEGGILVEGTAGTTGIGFVENVARKYMQYEHIWITIFVMGMLGLIFDLAMRWLITRTIPWRGKG